MLIEVEFRGEGEYQKFASVMELWITYVKGYLARHCSHLGHQTKKENACFVLRSCVIHHLNPISRHYTYPSRTQALPRLIRRIHALTASQWRFLQLFSLQQ